MQLQVLGPDRVMRACKMVNTLGMQGQINRNELRSAKLVHAIIPVFGASCFSEVNILKTLRDVKSVAQLICYDVLYSQATENIF